MLIVASALSAWPGALAPRFQAMDAAALRALPGKEKKPHEQSIFVTPPLNQAEQASAIETIQAVRRILLATPASQDVRGFEWATFGQISSQEPGTPVRMTLGYIAYPFFFDAKLNRAESSAEGAPFRISINDPDVILGRDGYRVDTAAHYTFAPDPAGTIDNFPVYGVEDRFVVITPAGTPLFVPVTQQQYLDLRIAQAKSANAEIKTSLASLPDSADKRTALSRAEGRVSALESELASLPESARQSPALMTDGVPTSRASSLADAGTTRTRAIVKANPALFDARKPRTAVQLIILGSVRYNPELFKALQVQIDKQALAALLR